MAPSGNLTFKKKCIGISKRELKDSGGIWVMRSDPGKVESQKENWKLESNFSPLSVSKISNLKKRIESWSLFQASSRPSSWPRISKRELKEECWWGFVAGSQCELNLKKRIERSHGSKPREICRISGNLKKRIESDCMGSRNALAFLKPRLRNLKKRIESFSIFALGLMAFPRPMNLKKRIES